MKLNGLEWELYFNEIAPNDAQMRNEDMTWDHKSFVGLWILDLDNETVSEHLFHNKFSKSLDFFAFFRKW